MKTPPRHIITPGQVPGAHHQLIRRLAASDRLGKALPLVTGRNRRRTTRRIGVVLVLILAAIALAVWTVAFLDLFQP